MGASLSNLGTNGSAAAPGLGDIPESCVARVFLHLTPPEICNLARLNRSFRGAASADSVWQTKLPTNYRDLLDLMPPERYRNLSKKDIFALLSRPVPFDDGNKEVWLDRVTGRVCMSISAKAMSITGIDDRRYWTWVPTEESRFKTVAYLQQIWWFEVDGEVSFPFPADVYTLSFRLHLGRFSKRLGRRVRSYEHTHGWDIKPVKFELSTMDGQQASFECCLDEAAPDDAHGNQKRGHWVDYKVGEFIVSGSEPTTKVRFSMKQIDCTHSKDEMDTETGKQTSLTLALAGLFRLELNCDAVVDFPHLILLCLPSGIDTDFNILGKFRCTLLRAMLRSRVDV